MYLKTKAIFSLLKYDIDTNSETAVNRKSKVDNKLYTEYFY